MPSIFFSRHPERIEIDAGPAICVYHRAYADKLPRVASCEVIEFGRLCDEFQGRDFFAGKKAVIFVGANRFFTPSTRFHPVFEILQYGLPGMARYAVDVAPYIGPLWRLFPHFSLAGVEFGGYTYSYLLESHYNAYLEGARAENPLSLDRIRRYAAGHVAIDYARYFAEPAVEVVPMPPDVRREYQALKVRLFDEHDGIGPIIKRLADFARAACPIRNIPQEHRIFETPDEVRIIRTDLKVDEYLTSRLLDKIAEVNRVVEALQP